MKQQRSMLVRPLIIFSIGLALISWLASAVLALAPFLLLIVEQSRWPYRLLARVGQGLPGDNRAMIVSGALLAAGFLLLYGARCLILGHKHWWSDAGCPECGERELVGRHQNRLERFVGRLVAAPAAALPAASLMTAETVTDGGRREVSRDKRLQLETLQDYAERPFPVAIAYLVALTAAEIISVFISPTVGATLHVLILFILLLHAALAWEKPIHRFLLSLTLVPLIRVISLSLPLVDFSLSYWFLITSVPLFSAAYVIMRQLNFSWRDLGLSWRSLPLQLLIGLTGILFGITEYFILRPDPLVESLSWQQIWLPAAILLISTGFLEEYVFRFLMQRTSVERLGRVLGIVYVGLLFAVLHIGYRSIVDLLFVLVVGLFFGLMAWKTRSIVGVTISHGLTNIMLFLIVPFVVLGIGVSPFDGARSLLDRGTHVTPTERLPDAAKTVPGDSATVEAISAAASKQTNQPGSDQVLDREAPDDNQEIDVSGLIIVDYSPGSELDVPSGVTTPQIASFRVVPYVSEVDGPADPN